MVLFIAFVIFITVRGELNDYLEIFGFGGGNLPNTTDGGSSGSSSGGFGGSGLTSVSSGGSSGGIDSGSIGTYAEIAMLFI